MHTIENELIRIEVNAKGAELNRIFSKTNDLDYLWNADPAFWAKKSPVLFPIVGTLKNNTYFYNKKSYTLPRHGFARDMEFALQEKNNTTLSFVLKSNPETLEKFPFLFTLEIIYKLEFNILHTTYKVYNEGKENMYFSVGGHPAFNLPLEKQLDYEDYYLEFSHTENALRWPISGEGLINPAATPLMTDSNTLPLNRELFQKDAIVLKYLNSESVKLKSDKSAHGLEFYFPHFPFLGIWAAKNANFVCIEPWCGIADSTITNQEFINKEGINLLTPGEIFARTWSVRFF